LPPPMDEDLLSCIIQWSELNAKFPQILNRDLRPVLQYSCVLSPDAKALNMFISSILYILDTYR
jgi:hypothetical protein